MGFRTHEICNVFMTRNPSFGYAWKGVYDSLEKSGELGLRNNIIREFPKPLTREEMASHYMKFVNANLNYFFNDAANVSYNHEMIIQDQYYFESGANMSWLETTTTGSENGHHNYRHQPSLFFTRGAARQYNKKWGWYIASYYNGYNDKGVFSGNNVANYLIPKVTGEFPDNRPGSSSGPGCGISTSLLTRDMFLAYMSGASFIQNENWINYLFKNTNTGNAFLELSSPYGKAWENWFEFTRKNKERGSSYTPIALLFPFEQGYPVYGGKSWTMFDYERPDWMIDAFMFTIIPHSPVTKNGDEGDLANSPYGDIYDAIVPNLPKAPIPLEVLNRYKVSVLLGRYPKSEALAKRLMEYVESGGTLLLNSKQIDEHFPVSFLGIEKKNVFTKGSMTAVKAPIRSSIDDTTFALSDDYEFEMAAIKGATTLLNDADGNVLECVNTFGRGKVIVCTVDYMVPKSSRDEKDYYHMNKMVYEKKFPFVEHILKNIVHEVLPLEINGDIEYGLNKLSDGWLLYLINNKGVTKFTNKEQTLDMKKTAKVEVSLRNIKASAITELREQRMIPKDEKNNSFTMDVPPGDIRVVKIKN